MVPYKGRARTPSYDPRIALAVEAKRVTRSAALAAELPALVERTRADIPLSLLDRASVNSGASRASKEATTGTSSGRKRADRSASQQARLIGASPKGS
jgi:hypothetical protein